MKHINGIPTLEELKAGSGWPPDKRFAEGPVAVLECTQAIPCNPCEAACPHKAISVGSDIITPPVLDGNSCVGCGLCIPQCPGLAIFVVDMTYSKDEATVEFPFEYNNPPERNSIISAVNRIGEKVCEGRVLDIKNSPSFGKTMVIKIKIPKDYAHNVRGILRR
jgi:Fe-S-cluster-containing hydrogenase component 2